MIRRLSTYVVLGLALALFLPATVLAQDTDGTVTGAVTDAETNETIPGANVVILGTSLGTATGVDGRFEIEDVPAGTQTIQISFTGYETLEEEIVISGGETLRRNFALSSDISELETVVVQGYRTRTQAEVTGAASRVDGETVEQQNIQNASEALQGRASGVRITSTSGQPGAAFQVQVRGQTSITAGTDPLFIIDGVQIETNDIANESNLSALVGVDPNDIESIEVLKDAASTSIYGARAANGVVLITTKGGRSGDTQVQFTTQLGAVTPLRNYDILSASQWAEYTFLEAANAGIPASAIASAYGITDADGNPITDPSQVTGPNWYDASTRTGFTQRYNLAISGGSEDTRFRVSGTYEQDRGQVIHSYLNQGGLRANIDHDISDVLTIGSKLNATAIRARGTISGGAFINSPFWAAYLIRPHLQIYNFDENGNRDGYNLAPAGGGAFNRNIVAQEDYNNSPTDANQLQGNVTANWQIAPWLFARTLAGVNHTDLSEKDYRSPRLPNNASFGGSAFVSNTRETEVNVSQTLNYNLTPGESHEVSGLLGTEFRSSNRQFNGVRAEGFPFYLFENLNNAAEPTNANEFETEARFLAYFGEVEYSYDDRYTARATLRTDGSSRFGSENRYGLFGSVAGAWTISEEAFMEDVGFLNNLSLRASYGVLGNSDFTSTGLYSNFAARRLFGSGGEYAGQPGLAPSSLGNPELTWEESKQTNIGFDYDLFGSRVYGAFNVYRTDTDQLLLPRNIPVEGGFSNILSNVGEIRNEGIEIDVNTVNVDAGDFRWDTNFNITFQRSEVLELYDGLEEIRNAAQPGGDLYRVGEPLGQYERVPWAGVNPANGRPLYRDADGNLSYFLSIPDGEETFGNVLADFYGGFGNTLSYAGLSLTAFFQFDYGRTTFNNDRYFIDGNFPYNHTTGVLENYWSEPGDVAGRPQPYLGTRPGGEGYGTGYFNSSRFMEDASYIRLKQLRLAYQIPASLHGGLAGLEGASIYFNATNLWTITDYTGLDPELVGTAIGQYPNNRRFVGGVRLSF